MWRSRQVLDDIANQIRLLRWIIFNCLFDKLYRLNVVVYVVFRFINITQNFLLLSFYKIRRSWTNEFLELCFWKLCSNTSILNSGFRMKLNFPFSNLFLKIKSSSFGYSKSVYSSYLPNTFLAFLFKGIKYLNIKPFIFSIPLYSQKS